MLYLKHRDVSTVGTFKYHTTPQRGGGLLKLSEYRHIRGGGLAKSSYNFYSGRKSFIHSFSCFILGICGGRGWLKTSYGGGLKLLLKKPSYDI